eukprot:3082298-Ditylum_brightwellii.AAC.2
MTTSQDVTNEELLDKIKTLKATVEALSNQLSELQLKDSKKKDPSEEDRTELKPGDLVQVLSKAKYGKHGDKATQPAATDPQPGGTPSNPNGGPNRNRNNRNSNRGGGNSTFKSFKGQVEELPGLGTRVESSNQNTGNFIKLLANYILVNFKAPGTLSRAVAELEDPSILLRGELPNLNSIMAELGIVLQVGTDTETVEERAERMRQNRIMSEPAQALYTQEMLQYTKKRNQLKENMAKLWGIILGQCTKALIEALRADHDFEQEQSTYNSIWLLKSIKRIAQGVTTSSNTYHTVFCAMRDFYQTKQFQKTVEDCSPTDER